MDDFKIRMSLWVALVFAAANSFAQPLPKIALQPKFTSLSIGVPTGMEEAPDGSGRFFVIEQTGRILTFSKTGDGSDAKEFLNITNREPHQSIEDGLLGLAFHPQFKSNGLVYIYYSLHEPRRTLLTELKTSADHSQADLKSERVLLEVAQPFDTHKAGQLAFGRDGYLYVALGDGGAGNDPFNNGQNTATLLGKILRIDVDHRTTQKIGNTETNLGYAIPADNPFASEPDLWESAVRKEIWALGLRNPWRFSFDRETGDLWAADVGQDKWEEINLVTKGGNYGWCVREGAHHFKPGPEGAHYIDPVMEYPHLPTLTNEAKFPDHGIGMCVIGGFVYRGKSFPSLRGVYVYGDYVLGNIWGFRYRDGKVTEHGTLLKQPKNITTFAQDADGELYVLAFDGKIFSIAVPQSENGR